MEYYILFVITLLVFKPITTFFHELGHAIPALIYTKGKVNMYIGSYGDPSKSWVFTIKRLRIFFKYKLAKWELGLCSSENQDLSVGKNMIIILMGPIASLIIGIGALLMGQYLLTGYSSFVVTVVSILSFLDFYANIVPKSAPIKLYDGRVVYNDGQQLKLLIQLSRLPKKYETASANYNNKKYDQASIQFQELLNEGYQTDFMYRLAISSYLLTKEYKKASKVNDEFYSKFRDQFDWVDYYNSGLMKSFLDDAEGAISDYSKSIELNSENPNSLNNRGYSYNLSGEYELAIEDFDKAIKLEENYAYALNNRGFAKVKLGQLEEGLIDIEKSFELDDQNSYCYMNYGVYYYENGEYKKALEKFEKAFELDNTTYGLEDHLVAVRKELDIE